MDKKMCSSCGDEKLISEFYRRSEKKKGYRSYCKDCTYLKQKTYNLSPDTNQKIVNRARAKLYGITVEEFESILLRQNGVCEICGEPETKLSKLGKVRSLSVDHDHVINKIRGLLCDRCNRVLGFMKDSPDHLRSAANYLEKYTSDNR